VRTIVQLRNIVLLISAVSMTAAFLRDGHWVIVGVLPAQTAFWFALRAHSVQWRSSSLLVLYVAFATIGIYWGLTATVLLVGTVTALAGWDLLNFGEKLKDASGPESINLLARSHLRSLFLALGSGTLLSFLSASAHLDLPFALVGGLALLLVASLARAAENLGSANR